MTPPIATIINAETGAPVAYGGIDPSTGAQVGPDPDAAILAGAARSTEWGNWGAYPKPKSAADLGIIEGATPADPTSVATRGHDGATL